MSFKTPTTKQLGDDVLSQIEGTTGQQVPLMKKAFTRVLSSTMGAVFILLYKYAGFMFLQMFASKATNEITEISGQSVRPLTEIGRLVGAGDAAPATQAVLSVQVTVINQVGTLAAGTPLINSTTGVTYLVLTTIALDASLKTAQVQASSDQSGGDGAGTIGNAQPGETLAFANPLPNVANDVLVLEQLTTGADAETEEQYRNQVTTYRQTPPQGGAYSDYRIWANSVAGIEQSYPYTSSICPGSVAVYVESSTEPGGIPSTAQLNAVSAAIEAQRPANGPAQARSITRIFFDVEITGLNVANPAVVEVQITEAIEEYFLGREPFIPGISVPPREDRITEASLYAVVEDVVAASGGIFELVRLTQNGIDVGFFTLSEGQKSGSGGVTFA